eukprot:CAMPEP_0119376214 /NCGR_PEP_ID=MMETSP1334-20130426/39540_1 /TAXON_ID=127549 /ORGANISM="Calcidiscus leptoporus, Strain RCC1130" /LENGTH=104 /DNA_ID=CAMNT_0007394735 /DNA_START=185 /DNA_END=500 /DNA_ORIENTATION=+
MAHGYVEGPLCTLVSGPSLEYPRNVATVAQEARVTTATPFPRPASPRRVQALGGTLGLACGRSIAWNGMNGLEVPPLAAAPLGPAPSASNPDGLNAALEVGAAI